MFATILFSNFKDFMEPINQQSFLKNANVPVETGLPPPKQISNKNYLVKQTTPLNPILSANKKTLVPQKDTWTTTTKDILASTGVLGLSYLGYQYLGTKPTPSPSILTNISIGNFVRTTIKVVGGIGLLTLVYSALGKREHGKPLNNQPLDSQNKYKGVEIPLMEKFEAAEKEFTTDIDAFRSASEDIIIFLDSQIFPKSFVKTFLASIQKKITNPSEITSDNYLFSRMLVILFNKLLTIDTNSALEIAKTCVMVPNTSQRGQSRLYMFCQSIIRDAMNSKIGFQLAIDCAKEKNSPECEQFTKTAAKFFFMKEDQNHQFTEFLKEIALGNNENLLKSILDDTKLFETATKLTTTKYDSDDKTKACNKIEEIFDIFIEAQNYKMATSLLQRYTETEDKNLQDWTKNKFYKHKGALLEASPVTANQLSEHFEELEQKSTDDDSDDFTEKVTTEYLENLKKRMYLDG